MYALSNFFVHTCSHEALRSFTCMQAFINHCEREYLLVIRNSTFTACLLSKEFYMATKHWFTWAIAAGLACGTAVAQEQARVISTVPVVQQVGVPQQFCEDAQVYSGQRTNGTGAIIGAVIGGVAGNALGNSGGRRYHGYGHRGYYQGPSRGASTVVGAIAGGLIGNVIESSNSQPTYETVRKCTNETVYENRTVAYDVTYEYAGRQYNTRLDHNPGAWIPVNVQALGSYSSSSGASAGFVGPTGIYQSAPAGVVVTESITYSQPRPPVVVGVDVSGYPAQPPTYRPTPSPYYWR